MKLPSENKRNCGCNQMQRHSKLKMSVVLESCSWLAPVDWINTQGKQDATTIKP